MTLERHPCHHTMERTLKMSNPTWINHVDSGADAEATLGSHWNVCFDSKGCINDAIFKALVVFLLSM